jgi:hypothetical protein
MKVKFLKSSTAKIKDSRCCGDGCCSFDEWIEDFFSTGEEVEAVAEQSNFLPNGTVVLDGLKFNEDFIITEFP